MRERCEYGGEETDARCAAGWRSGRAVPSNVVG